MISTVNEIKEWLNEIEQCLNSYANLDGYKDKNFLIDGFKVQFCDEDAVDSYITIFMVDNGETYSIMLPQSYESLTESQLGAYLYGAVLTEFKYK